MFSFGYSLHNRSLILKKALKAIKKRQIIPAAYRSAVAEILKKKEGILEPKLFIYFTLPT